jgi:hypothetical protein
MGHPHHAREKCATILPYTKNASFQITRTMASKKKKGGEEEKTRIAVVNGDKVRAEG